MARRQCEGIGWEGCVMWSLLTYLLVCLLHEHWHVIYSAAPFLKRMWDLRQTAELQEESWKFLLLGREESPGSRSSRSPSCAWNNCIIPSKHVKTLKQGSSRLAISMAHRRCWPILSRQRRLPDYYSKYPFVDKLPTLPSIAAWNHCLRSKAFLWSCDQTTVRNSLSTVSGNEQTNTDSDTLRLHLSTQEAIGSSRAKWNSWRSLSPRHRNRVSTLLLPCFVVAPCRSTRSRCHQWSYYTEDSFRTTSHVLARETPVKRTISNISLRSKNTEDLQWRTCTCYATESCCATQPVVIQNESMQKQVETSDCEVYWPAFDLPLSRPNKARLRAKIESTSVLFGPSKFISKFKLLNRSQRNINHQKKKFRRKPVKLLSLRPALLKLPVLCRPEVDVRWRCLTNWTCETIVFFSISNPAISLFTCLFAILTFTPSFCFLYEGDVVICIIVLNL